MDEKERQLSDDELEAENGEELPDREVMSVSNSVPDPFELPPKT